MNGGVSVRNPLDRTVRPDSSPGLGTGTQGVVRSRSAGRAVDRMWLDIIRRPRNVSGTRYRPSTTSVTSTTVAPARLVASLPPDRPHRAKIGSATGWGMLSTLPARRFMNAYSWVCAIVVPAFDGAEMVSDLSRLATREARPGNGEGAGLRRFPSVAYAPRGRQLCAFSRPGHDQTVPGETREPWRGRFARP